MSSKMSKTIPPEKKPRLGFFPLFYNLAETCRAALIAKRYMELGGEAVFFSHGGEYEYIAKNIGCEIVRVNPIYSKEYINLLWESSRLETFKNPFSKKILIEHVEEEITAYKKTDVKMIVSTNNFPCNISARAAKIPLVFVTPRAMPSYTKYPDDAEFFFTRWIPQALKLKILNWYAPNSKIYVRPFTKLAKQYNVPVPRLGSDIIKGDFTLYTDFIELLGLNKTSIPANEYYIGPIFFDELFDKDFSKGKDIKEEHKIEKHLQKHGKSILFSLGSSGTKEIFLKILSTLNKTNYNVVAVYSSILEEEDLPEVNNNILLKKHVPSMEKLNKNVDLAIIHGGQGTVYTAAYAGKPVVGFPMQFEQHLNLEMLVKQGMAVIESRKYFKEKNLLKNVNKIFDNYDTYLNNAQNLAKRLPKPEGDKNAVKILIDILEKNDLK